MLKVKIEKIDKLNDLLAELGALIYLQKLIEKDVDATITFNQYPNEHQRYIPFYLLENQDKVLNQIYNLVNNGNFGTSDKCINE